MSTKTAKKEVPAASKYQAELISAILDYEAQEEALQEAKRSLEAKLIRSVGLGNSVASEQAQVTVVAQTHRNLDFEQLVEQHPTWARRVTKKVLDRSALTHLLAANAVPEHIRAMVVETQSAPFLRTTLRQAEG